MGRAPRSTGAAGAGGASRVPFGPWRVAAAVLLAVAAVLWLSSMTWNQRPTTSAPLLLPLGAAAGLVLVTRAARGGREAGVTDLAGILATGLALRLVGLWVRYRDAADALEYHQEGTRIADSFRSLDLSVHAGRPVPGTGTVRLVSGAVHAVTFDDLLTSFVVFTLVAFGGSLLLVRAFRVALPDADLTRYAVLIMVWPSLWFWPSSLGKESLMLLGLGAASLGVAHLFAGHRAPALAWSAAGLVVIGFVRPHVGLIVLVGLAVTLVARPTARSTGRRTGQVLLAAVLLVGGAVLSQATADRLQLDSFGTEQVSEAIELTADRTSSGDASFPAATVRTPVDYPWAVITVLLRPFPNEASGLSGLVASSESLALGILVLLSLRRLQTTVRDLRRSPYLLYCLVFVATFCFAFSAIGNFGILARQRSQVLPFIFVLLATRAATTVRAEPAERRRSWWAGRRAGGPRRSGPDDSPPPRPHAIPLAPSRRHTGTSPSEPPS